MKAAVLYGREDVRVDTIQSRPLEPGEVRVGIRAALTCGTDLKVFKRGYHAKMIVPPAVFGHEFAGVISEVHPNTTGWSVGDRVVAANSAPCGLCLYCQRGQENLCDDLLFLNGAYAESIVVPARICAKNLLRLHPATSFVSAALTEPLACVVLGMQDICLRPQDHLLVIGSGPIGLMFVCLARHLGCRVSVLGRGRNRLEQAYRLGAASVLEAGVDDAQGMLDKAQIPPFDCVVEAVGKPDTWELALQLVRKGGTVNLFGGCPAGSRASLDTSRVHYSSLRICSTFHHTPGAIRKALAYVEAGVVTAADFVDGACALTDLPALFRSMVAGNRSVKTSIELKSNN
jgi:L-iditol 2-dehydrogenase